MPRKKRTIAAPSAARQQTQLMLPDTLDLFQPRPIDVSILKTQNVIIRPQNELTSLSPLEFFLPANMELFLDPSMVLHLTGNITNEDNTPLAAGDAVALTQYPIAGLFANLTMELNNILVYSANNS